ncbi:MAG: DUF4384 domain-containing protein [Bryobacterales bacterium]|nr:DUF4384 domain-containing protein [Bryobacterales bacterium]
MLFSLRLAFAAFLVTAGLCLSQSTAPPPAAGARAMFFGGFDTPPSKAVSAPAKKTVAKAAAPARAPKTAPASPAVAVAPQPEPAAAAPRRPSVPVINAGRVPLGLRYAILREDGVNGVEVAPTTRFKSGDRIRLKVQSNSDGYLYIVSQGTSGAWQVVFPTKNRRNGSNRMKAGEEESWNFRFSGKPGVEKLFAVLSRTPEADLDSLLYDLSGVPSPDGVKRAAATPAGPAPLLMAGNLTVSDPLVNRLRTSYTRDLVLEEVGDATASAAAAAAPEEKSGERAIYVVNRTNGPDSRVVADIKLIHE